MFRPLNILKLQLMSELKYLWSGDGKSIDKVKKNKSDLSPLPEVSTSLTSEVHHSSTVSDYGPITAAVSYTHIIVTVALTVIG